MLINSIEDALKLVLYWVGRSDVAVPPRAPASDLATPLPDGLSTVVAVSDALGTKAFTPIAAPLLTTQDRILRPEQMRADNAGYTTFVVENQGTFSFGYRPSVPDRLFVSGDWGAIPEGTVPPGWRTVAMRPEEALIMTTLVNGFFGLSARLKLRDEADFDTVPADCDVLLWRHDAMGTGWPGFMTNAARTRLHFGGFGQTLMRG